MSQETVLITGASSGIGAELARLFVHSGSTVILVARRVDRLDALANELRSRAGNNVHVVARDLTEEGSIDELLGWLQSAGLHVDVLVNNAGFGQLGRFPDIPVDRQRSMIELNVSALTALTHRVLPGMIERGRGAILNLGSTASFQPGPNAAVYYASKAYVLSFSEALSAELAGTGVSVTCLCPGPTRTEFGETSDMEETVVFKYNSMDVKAVARAGYQGVRRKRRLVVPGTLNWLGAFMVRLTPRGTLLKVMEALQPLPRK